MLQLNQDQPFLILDTEDIFIGMIDGQHCTTLSQFYQNIHVALQFPDYFGENLDALDELLHDMNWLDQSSIIFLIKNKAELLSQESEDTRIALLELLNEVDEMALSIIWV